MSEPKGPDYKTLDSIGTGTVAEIAQQVLEVGRTTFKPDWTIEEATVFTQYAADLADKRENAIENLERYKGKKIRRTKKNMRTLAHLERWNRDGERYSFLKPAGRNFAGTKVYTGATRRPKLHIRNESDCKPGSWHKMFWKLQWEHGQYFFKEQLLETMEQTMGDFGEFKNEDGQPMTNEERADKVAKVWDIGRRGKDRRGFFDKKEFNEFTEPIWYAIGTEPPELADVENLPIPEPEFTDLQKLSKEQFQGVEGFKWRHFEGESWKFYEPSCDPWVKHLIENEYVYDGEDSQGNSLTAEEWAVRKIDFATDIDDPRKKTLYYDNDPKSQTYKALCYAGWIPEEDREKWSNFRRCTFGSYKFRQLAQQIGPYSMVGKVRSKSMKSHPMYGCNPTWQGETAVKLGICILRDGQFVGVNTHRQEQEQWKIEGERKAVEAAAKEAELRAKEAAEMEKGKSRRNIILKEVLNATDWEFSKLESRYSGNGWLKDPLAFKADCRAFEEDGTIIVSEDRQRFSGANVIRKREQEAMSSDTIGVWLIRYLQGSNIDPAKVYKVIYASDADGCTDKTDYRKAMSGMIAEGIESTAAANIAKSLRDELGLTFINYPGEEQKAAA
jgi:hypothetical protein